MSQIITTKLTVHISDLKTVYLNTGDTINCYYISSGLQKNITGTISNIVYLGTDTNPAISLGLNDSYASQLELVISDGAVIERIIFNTITDIVMLTDVNPDDVNTSLVKAKVEQVAEGALLTITDKNGVTTALIENGRAGDPGPAGAKGSTPRVNVFQGENYATITITDDVGPQYFTLNDGISPSVVVEEVAEGVKLTVTDADGPTSAIIPKGVIGFSPVVTTQAVEGGTKVTITDVSGDNIFTINNGAEGISPTVSMARTAGGATVNITDKDGTKSVSLNDGAPGIAEYNGVDPVPEGTKVRLVDRTDPFQIGSDNIINNSITPEKLSTDINDHLEVIDNNITQVISDLQEIVNGGGISIQNAYSASFVPSKSRQAIASKFVPELRNASEFDVVTNTTLSKGIASPTVDSSNAVLVRAIDTSCKNYSVQALLYWSSAVSEYIGFNTVALGQAFSSVTEFIAAGFNNTGLILWSGGGAPSLLMSMSGYSDGWYTMTMTVTNDGKGFISISPVGSVYKTKTFEVTGLTSINNFNSFCRSPSVSSSFKNVKVLADINNIYNFLIPIIDSSKNFNTCYSFTISGIKTILSIPASYNHNVKNRCAIFNHGAGVSATDLWDSPSVSKITDALLDAGYVVIATDCTSLASWGNNQSGIDLADMVAFYKNIVNIQDEFYVMGQSMGGLVSLNGIYHQKIKAKAFVGFYPVLNLAGIFKDSYEGGIKIAYGFSNSADFETATNGYDPLNDNDGTLLAKIPAKIWQSPADTIVIKTLHADAYASKINALGGNVTIVSTTGDHGDASNYDATSVVNFFNNY